MGSAKAAKSRSPDLDPLNQHGTVQSRDLSDDIDLTQVDLSPLLTTKSLKEVYFHPKKKHYSHGLKEINAAFGK